MGSRASWIRTYDNAILIVPNSDLTAKQIVNWTASDPKVRIAVPVSVSHGSNPEEVIRILLELGRRHEDLMAEPSPDAILSEVGPNSLTFVLRTLTRANDFATLRSDLFREILRRFEEERIKYLSLKWILILSRSMHRSRLQNLRRRRREERSA